MFLINSSKTDLKTLAAVCEGDYLKKSPDERRSWILFQLESLVMLGNQQVKLGALKEMAALDNMYPSKDKKEESEGKFMLNVQLPEGYKPKGMLTTKSGMIDDND